MNTFLKYIVLFLFGTLLINLILNSAFNYTCNKAYSEKLSHIQSNPFSANTFFWGSSRTFRQVNPAAFDTLSSNKLIIKSFNFGAPATFAPETYFLYDTYLDKIDKTDTSRKNVFLELNKLNEIAFVNLLSKQNYYWLDYKYALHLSKYHFKKSVNLSRKLIVPGKVIFSYIINKVGFNYINTNEKLEFGPLGPASNGFYSLQNQLSERPSYTIRNRNKEFLNDTMSLIDRRKEAVKAYSIENFKYQSCYYDHVLLLEKLIRKSESHGINMFFVIPPRLQYDDYKELLAIKSLLPKNSVIDLGNPLKYPELWDAAHSFDVGHLNDSGSEIYTRLLSSEFNSRIDLHYQ